MPAGWQGSLDKLPYPDYVTPLNLKEPQTFPEKGDLTKAMVVRGEDLTTRDVGVMVRAACNGAQILHEG